jgi:hypothetical protein
MRKSHLFELIWKAKFSPNPDTVGFVLRKLNDELSYLSTVALPMSSGRQFREILRQIETLKTHKENLEKKSVDWKKNYDESRNPRPVREITPDKSYGDASERVTFARKSLNRDQYFDVLDYARYLERKGMSPEKIKTELDNQFDIYPDEINEILNDLHKSLVSVSNKKELFKRLYQQVWDTQTGLNEADLNKMSEGDLDKAINSLRKIFEKSNKKIK